jgi:O-methyltransferase
MKQQILTIETLSKGVNFLFGNVLNKKNIFIGNSLSFLHRKRKIDRNYFDYIRLATLELVSHEITRKNIEGSVAELGVYKGKFARYINKYFPDSILYLFDTFEGFDSRDIESEKVRIHTSVEQDFSDTSVDAVLKIMPYPDKCVIVKGFFPESAKGRNATYKFVSIDADLYEPIYNGLVFFYPKLVPGGYIFIHDYNNDRYKGSRKAVEQFCTEQKINCVPLPDSGGSVIIIK